MSHVLTISNLSVSYQTEDGSITPLQNISMDLLPGKLYGLIGATGSGKSTLIKAIGGVLPQNAIVTGGSIFLGDKKSDLCSTKESPTLGIVLQDPYGSLNPTMRIISQFRSTYGWINSFVHQREFLSVTREMVDLVGLKYEDLRKYPAQLSGGMNQRINIALSLIKKPRLLLLDEPTSALDAHLKHEIMDMLLYIQKKLGICILLISHDIKLVQEYAERIFLLSNGKLIENHDNAMRIDLDGTPCLRNSDRVLLQCDNLTKSFSGKKVLDNLSFTVYNGECVGIVGPSGSGKSTICKILMGMYTPDSGCFSASKKLAVEMLFQDAGSSLDPSMTVKQIINEAIVLNHRDPMTEDEMVELLTKFSLPANVLTHLPKQLSGGQRQMIAMLRVLLATPDLVILDEPTSAMDVFMQKSLLDFLKTIQRDYNLTYLLVSHDLEVIDYMCSSVVDLSMQ